MGRWNGEREGGRPKTCQEKGKGAQFSQGDQMKCVKIIPNTLLRGIERDYSVVAATWALAAASLASLVEGGKPHLCQEVGRRLPVCLSSRDHGCQIAKFDPFLSLDCARVEGVGHNPRKGRNPILQCSIAEP